MAVAELMAARSGIARSGRIAVATIAAATALLAAPPAAPAATSCDYSSTGKLLQVVMSATDDIAVLSVSGTGQIVVESDIGGPTVTCSGTGGPATVNNTDVVQAFSQSPNQNNRVDIDGAGNFGPGAGTTGENGGTPEVEIFVNLRGSGQLRVFTAATGGSTRVGTDGINPNATSTEVEPDTDIFLTEVPQQNTLIAGGVGTDALSAQGGLGTGNPLTEAIRIESGNGGGGVEGGEGGDTLRGGFGQDAIFGRGGTDSIFPAAENDEADGGPGTDFLSYAGDTTGGITLDLAVITPQSIGGGGGTDQLVNFENASGTSFADTLRGDGGPNTLFGVAGVDVMEGRGGVDTLVGAAGNDNLDVRDGGPDTAICGADTDTVTADAPGVDTLNDCENVLFPVVAAAGGAAGAAGGGTAGIVTGAATGPDGTAANVTDYGLSELVFAAASTGGSVQAARRRPKVGTTVRYTLSELATVTFTVERAASGRRVRGKCTKPTRRNRQRRRCRRFRKLRGSFTHAGRTGRNSFKFTGRLRGRKLSPGRYRLVATAVDTAGNKSKLQRAGFRVVAR